MISAIIQARMGSTRLPRKVLMQIEDESLLSYQINRILKSKLIDNIILATTTEKIDDEIVSHCKELGVDYFRGSENDVLGRYYETAKYFKSDVIVRMTADCPLLDPNIIDKTVQLFLDEKVNYAANTVPPENSKFPDGSDVEVFDFKSLEIANLECKDKHDREHVTFYFWKYNNSFSTAQLDSHNDFSKYRFTIDYPEDFEVLDFLINEIRKRKILGTTEEIVQLLDSNPEIKEKNSKYFFGIGWQK